MPDSGVRYLAGNRKLRVTAFAIGAIAVFTAAANARGQIAELASLPDAPSSRAGMQGVQAIERAPGHPLAEAGPYDKYIDPDQQAPGLTARDKAILGVRDAFSPTAIVVWFLVAGYEQATDGSPNWPQNKAGYFRRLGAAAIRDSSDGMFGDSVLCPLFRQDPRYYKAGHRKGLVYRTFYSLTRPLVTRMDSGREAPNLSLILGTAGGAILTDAYYPAGDQGVRKTAETFGGSMGSSALGDFVAEFADDFLVAIRLKHRQ